MDCTERKFNGNIFSKDELRGHEFEDCIFEKCDFKEAVLDYTKFVNCSFVSCDLSNVSMRNSRMRDCSFKLCKLLGMQWIHLDDLMNPSFEESMLDYGNFTNLKLKKIKFMRCVLRDVDFSQADLSESLFKESDCLNARFQQTTLLKADFRGAINYLINPIENKLKGAKFSMPEAQGLLAGMGVVIE